MKLYYDSHIGTFISRPNRFIAHIDLDGEEIVSHVPNTGRLRELLIPGATVMLSYHPSESRKTKYELRMVKKGDYWISIDSQLPNALAQEAILNETIKELTGYSQIKREAKYQNSRFDLRLSKEGPCSDNELSTYDISRDDDSSEASLDNKHICFVEVKGVTLEREGWSYFPDAPTERGRKHIDELIDAVKEGYRAVLLFVVQLEYAAGFSPNKATDPAFDNKVEEAIKAGVEVLAYRSIITPNEVRIIEKIPVVI